MKTEIKNEQNRVMETKEIWNWRGAGWYAPCQEGQHDSQCVVWYRVGEDPDEQPDTYGMGLGTPIWEDVPPCKCGGYDGESYYTTDGVCANCGA